MPEIPQEPSCSSTFWFLASVIWKVLGAIAVLWIICSTDWREVILRIQANPLLLVIVGVAILYILYSLAERLYAPDKRNSQTMSTANDTKTTEQENDSNCCCAAILLLSGFGFGIFFGATYFCP
ncbi:MAG: hypothetical protein OXO48_13805 [Caldilineaceae bacterium]|nr:hypothetical protein [Caldilineaceae bacterium]